MPTFKVVHEITVDAENSLEAAKTIQKWMDDADTKWQFYVQRTGSKNVRSIDLNEDDSEAVQLVKKYKPMIKN